MKFIKGSALILVLIIISLFATACGTPREPMDVNVFRSVMESEGYEIVDLIPGGADYAYHDLGVITDHYTFVFGEMKTIAYATNAFNSMRRGIEDAQGSTRTYRSVSLANHSLFEQTSGGVFSHVYRVDNTILYVRADSAYRDYVRELIDRILP